MFKMNGLSIWILIFIIPLCILSTTPDIQIKSDQKELSEALQKAADYYEKLKSQSVYYYCREKIIETIYPMPKKYRAFLKGDIGIQGDFTKFRKGKPIVNSYLYDFQVIRKGKKESEKRILLKENGVEKYKKNSILKTKIFIYNYVVYGPEIFEKKSQKFYNFSITGREKWKGKESLIIRAVPKPGVRKDLSWGEFWIDVEDFSFLKINIAQRSIGNFYNLEKKARVMNARAKLSILLECNIKNKGIRFPSRFLLKEVYITKKGESIILSEIDVSYSDYTFFNVDIKVQEKELAEEDTDN